MLFIEIKRVKYYYTYHNHIASDNIVPTTPLTNSTRNWRCVGISNVSISVTWSTKPTGHSNIQFHSPTKPAQKTIELNFIFQMYVSIYKRYYYCCCGRRINNICAHRKRMEYWSFPRCHFYVSPTPDMPHKKRRSTAPEQCLETFSHRQHLQLL